MTLPLEGSYGGHVKGVKTAAVFIKQMLNLEYKCCYQMMEINVGLLFTIKVIKMLIRTHKIN